MELLDLYGSFIFVFWCGEKETASMEDRMEVLPKLKI